ncbi:MAG TPA: ABC transporter permease [Vicinamibacteria bacterium]|nr:ABC transporter permease [Vicinamibacteria bacterium]
MHVLAYLRSALRHLLAGRGADRELQDEIAAHIELLAEEKIAAGLDTAAARRRALVETGGVERVKEEVRDVRAGSGLAGLLRDMALAARSLRRAPGLVAVVTATLALGIGANTAIFSAAWAVLQGPLPYAHPEKLFMIWSDLQEAGYHRAPLSGPELLDLREGAPGFKEVAAIWTTTGQLTGDGDPEQIRLALVTANFFRTLGVVPALGRDFLPEEEGPEARVLLLGHSLWQRRYGGDPGVVGRTVRMDGGNATIVGVLPAAFQPVFAKDANVPPDVQAFSPFVGEMRARPRALYFLRVLGRARPDASPAQAVREVEAVSAAVVPRHSEYVGSGRRFYAASLRDDVSGELRPALLALLLGVLILLALACVNVATVLLARGRARRKETAIRVALGAAPRRLWRETLAEGLVLAALGGTAGVLLGALGIEALRGLRPESLSRLAVARLDAPVLLFALGVSVTAGLVFSLAPLREALRTEPREALSAGSRGAAALPHRVRGGLVVAQVALGAVLLVGAGLLVRSFHSAGAVSPGYDKDGILTFRLSLPFVRYPTTASANAFARELERRLRSVPGVAAVGAVSHVPLDSLPNWSTPYVYDAVAGQPRGSHEADARAVSPGYFEAVGAEIVAGRVFVEADDERSRPVVVVDERLAARAWPGRDAVGQSLEVEFMKDGDFVPTKATVVGVVRHLRHRSLTEEVREQVYLPYRQSRRDPMAYVVRTRADVGTLAAAVHAEVAALDKDLPAYDVRPLEAYVRASLDARRFVMLLSGLFAAVALLLAAVGTYGVLAWAVSRRQQEFGVRRTLGAGPLEVLRLVLSEGLGLAATGLLVGLAAAAVLTPALRGLLFGVGPLDPLTYASVALVVAAATVVACVVPARRALTQDPVEVLRLL